MTDIKNAPMDVSVLGAAGSFHHIAAEDIFGQSARFLEVSNPSELFTAVVENKAEYGLIAIENSTAGYVYDHLKLLVSYPITVVGDYFLHIDLQLCTTTNNHLEDIHTVYSHPVAFGQAQKFLGKYRSWQQITVSDNALAAGIAAIEGDGTAALCSLQACQMNNLKILAGSVGDLPDNKTRFLLFKAGTNHNREIYDWRHKADRGQLAAIDKGSFQKNQVIIGCFYSPEDERANGGLWSLFQMYGASSANEKIMPKRICRIASGYYIEFEWKNANQAELGIAKLIAAEAVLKVLGIFKSRPLEVNC